jgi:hypothetical protein
MFRRVRLSIIRSLFTVHSVMVYVTQVCRQLSSRTRMLELSETCRVSCQNKFVKLVHLFGFIIKKFVTMHGHTNVKFNYISLRTIYYYPSIYPRYSKLFLPFICPHQSCLHSTYTFDKVSFKIQLRQQYPREGQCEYPVSTDF